MLEPGIYTGTLRHRRFRPRAHAFEYSIFMTFLDIDRIPETMARSWATSYNRINWASFEERDHFGDPALPLRERLRVDAAAHGVELPDGPVYLLTHLRYLGYCFNPISFFYCHDRAGHLRYVMAEVNSTFGEAQNYWLNGLRTVRPKSMHVSPFMEMNYDYAFTLTAPGDRLVAHMECVENPRREAGTFFDATLTMERRPWTSGEMTRALARHPWMTAKVIGAIHWEALRLWMKRVPVVTHPARRKPA